MEKQLAYSSKCISGHLRFVGFWGLLMAPLTPFSVPKRIKLITFHCKFASETKLTTGEEKIYRQLRMHPMPSKIMWLLRASFGP